MLSPEAMEELRRQDEFWRRESYGCFMDSLDVKGSEALKRLTRKATSYYDRSEMLRKVFPEREREV